MAKARTIIWGVGGTTRDFLEKESFYRDYDIIAFVDNNSSYKGMSFLGKPILNPMELFRYEFDVIIICSLYECEIRRQIDKYDLNVEIVSIKDIRDEIRKKLICANLENNDIEIKEAISFYKNHELNIFGRYNPPVDKYYVNRDKTGSPYILFDGKRMYYPNFYKFSRDDNGEYVADVLYEQKEGSPHLYVRQENDIFDGSVVIDAGTCEGNFALRYIEKVKKIYLIESDHIWMEALRKTFAPYNDKVVFCNKYLSRYDSQTTITIDSLVKENIDFLKMDIEGAEIDALLGGKETLRQSNCKCAICSYHRQNDEENIRFILSNLGYETSTSKGVMFFEYDKNIIDTLDFRHGIVYAYKTEQQTSN